jgi:hypothetical protein
MAETFQKELHSKGIIVERVEQIVRNFNKGFEGSFNKVGEDMTKSEVADIKRIFTQCKELKC